MDIDVQYPALSALAQDNGHTLNKLGKTAPKQGSYLRLNGCCFWVLKNLSRHGAPDPYNYLSTLNRLLEKLPAGSDARSRIWRKLVDGTPSAFLDTMVEAAWALHFWDKGYSATIEEPFDPADPSSKDADIAVTIENKRHWLDILNVELKRPRNNLVNELAKRATKKYKSKFYKAVSLGPLDGAPVGILLCLLKSEGAMISLLLNKPSPPPELFSPGSPGLEMLWVHTLRSDSSSDLLRPCPVLAWTREEN